MAVLHFARRACAVSRVQVRRNLLYFVVRALAQARVKQADELGERPAASVLFNASLTSG